MFRKTRLQLLKVGRSLSVLFFSVFTPLSYPGGPSIKPSNSVNYQLSEMFIFELLTLRFVRAEKYGKVKRGIQQCRSRIPLSSTLVNFPEASMYHLTNLPPRFLLHKSRSNYCLRIVQVKGASTTSFLGHLKRLHAIASYAEALWALDEPKEG